MSSNAIATPSLAIQLESLSALIRRTESFCQRISAVGMYIFMGLVILTFADVLLRYVIGSPISGSIEITEMLMSVVLFSSVAYTYWRRGHVSMDIVTGKLSELNKDRLGIITTVWSLAVIFFCITCMSKYAIVTTDTTSVWDISYKPFIWFAVFGCVLLFLAMLSHLFDQFAGVIRGSGMQSAFLMLGIGLLSVALSVWVAVDRLPSISAPTQGVIGMVYMFTMFFLGMPVAFALMGTSLVFIASLRGLTAALNLFGTAWFSTCSSYTWAPLMFFLLMGFLCFYSRFGEDLYLTARNWCGHFRGGLAIASVCACTGLNDTGKTISMAFTVLGGAGVFSYFMTMSKIPMILASVIASMNMPPMAVMFAIIVCMSFLGCFIPAIPLMLICVPIFLPLATLFGWNLIWFGVIINILVTMAGMSPPFGVSLFVAKELADVPLALVYRSSIPFILAFFLCLGFCIAFEPLSTWLPAMMK